MDMGWALETRIWYISGCEDGLPVHEFFQLTPPKLELYGCPLHSGDDSVGGREIFFWVLLSRGSWRAGWGVGRSGGRENISQIQSISTQHLLMNPVIPDMIVTETTC